VRVTFRMDADTMGSSVVAPHWSIQAARVSGSLCHNHYPCRLDKNRCMICTRGFHYSKINFNITDPSHSSSILKSSQDQSHTILSWKIGKETDGGSTDPDTDEHQW
jgi:hypothetical protein